jgi:hypothetical protein
MIARSNLLINGKFKFDVFDRTNQLRYTIEDSNFITPQGLEYIKTYGFADSFRYLSLGSGAIPNTATGNNLGTTGLQIPLSKEFSYLGGNTNINSCFDPTNRYVSAGCGTTFTNTGVTLSRSWRIPETEDTFFTIPYTFKEYMCSPGRGRITGWIDESTTGSVCSCNSGIYNNPQLTGVIYGRESTDFALKYDNICTDLKAFTRIVKDISTIVDDYLVVTYSLDVNYNTGVSKFQIGVNRNNPYPSDEYYNWVTGSGAFNIVHPSIKLINNGDVTNVLYVPQINDSYEFRVGESYVPPLGNPLEPNCSDENIQGYISNDNLLFLVNEISGGAAPYIHLIAPSGLMRFHKNWIAETSSTNSVLGDIIPQLVWASQPRSETTDLFETPYPSQTDYNNPSASTDIAGGTFTPKSFEPNVTSSSFDASLPFTGRIQGRVISFQYKEPTISEDLPVRAFVYGFTSSSYGYVFPSVDMLFHATGSTKLATPVSLPARTYSSPLDPMTSKSTAGYYYMDENNILQIQNRISWSAPCPIGISGC